MNRVCVRTGTASVRLNVCEKGREASSGPLPSPQGAGPAVVHSARPAAPPWQGPFQPFSKHMLDTYNEPGAVYTLERHGEPPGNNAVSLELTLSCVPTHYNQDLHSTPPQPWLARGAQGAGRALERLSAPRPGPGARLAETSRATQGPGLNHTIFWGEKRYSSSIPPKVSIFAKSLPTAFPGLRRRPPPSPQPNKTPYRAFSLFISLFCLLCLRKQHLAPFSFQILIP